MLVDDGGPVLTDRRGRWQDLGPDRARILGWPGPLLLADDLAVFDPVLPAVELDPDLHEAGHVDLDLGLAEHAVRLRAGDRRPIEAPHDLEFHPAGDRLEEAAALHEIGEIVAAKEDEGEISCCADSEVVPDRHPGHPPRTRPGSPGFTRAVDRQAG